MLRIFDTIRYFSEKKGSRQAPIIIIIFPDEVLEGDSFTAVAGPGEAPWPPFGEVAASELALHEKVGIEIPLVLQAPGTLTWGSFGK